MLTDLLRKIASITPPLHFLGGIAEDIVLRGEVGEGHRDLDFLVPVERLGTAAEQLALSGLVWQPHEDQPGRPWVFDAGNSLPVEVWPCLTGTSDKFFAIVPGINERLFRLQLPADTFLDCYREINGLKFHTVSPLALYRMRLASAQTRHEGLRRERDLAVAAELREVFLSYWSEEELAISLEELGN